MELGLKDKLILVTGGASGIGAAVVSEAQAEGMRVVVLDAQAPSSAEHLPWHRVDVTDDEATAKAVEAIESELGPIDAVVTSAGLGVVADARTSTMAEWSKAIDVNLTGSYVTARAAGARMLDRGRGAIVLIGSAMSFGSSVGRTAYASSKHGIVGLTRSLAIEWGAQGVRVNAIAPGTVDTPMFQRNYTPDDVRDMFLKRIPLQRLSTAKEQAQACLFLLSDAASYITGTTLSVDGGMTAGHLINLPVE